MRGRKPKPTAQQISEGDPRKLGKRKLEEKLANEPKATRGLPSCPRHLKGRARYAWTFWSDELVAMNIDRRPDGPMLEGACVSYARAVQADLILEAEGLIVYDKFIDEDGEAVILKTKKHPAVEISNRSWLMVKAFCSEFGLSPVARTRIKLEAGEADGEDEFMKALSQPRERPASTGSVH